MSDRLELPAELQALLEKRENEDRRQSDESVSAERRSGADRRSEDAGSSDATD